MKAVILIFSTLILSGCSDFLNSKGSDSGNSLQEKTQTGENPFPEGYDPNQGEFTESKMLANIGLNVIQPMVKDFRLQAELLDSRIQGTCVNDIERTKTQWKEVMRSFHQVDSLPIGPLAENNFLLQDHIYNWPAIDACTIDVEIEKLSRTNVVNNQLMVNLKGLGALEYILFTTPSSSSCNVNLPRYANLKVWLEKPMLEKKSDRCRFAKQLVSDLVEKAKTLERSWDQNQGNYSKSFSEGENHGKSVKEAVNALSDSLFEVEKVKDERLGMPLGLHATCTTGKCIEKIEHQWSDISFESIEERLKAFRLAFEGAGGFGFDDYLLQMNHQAVSSAVLSAVDQAEVALSEAKALGTLKSQVDSMAPRACESLTSEVKVCQLFRKVREISNVMKTDFLTALSLRAPPTYQGDND